MKAFYQKINRLSCVYNNSIRQKEQPLIPQSAENKMIYLLTSFVPDGPGIPGGQSDGSDLRGVGLLLFLLGLFRTLFFRAAERSHLLKIV